MMEVPGRRKESEAEEPLLWTGAETEPTGLKGRGRTQGSCSDLPLSPDSEGENRAEATEGAVSIFCTLGED